MKCSDLEIETYQQKMCDHKVAVEHKKLFGRGFFDRFACWEVPHSMRTSRGNGQPVCDCYQKGKKIKEFPGERENLRGGICIFMMSLSSMIGRLHQSTPKGSSIWESFIVQRFILSLARRCLLHYFSECKDSRLQTANPQIIWAYLKWLHVWKLNLVVNEFQLSMKK